MSQRSVEGLLGRLVTDRQFRQLFYEDPAGTCLRQSIDLTARELEAVLALEESRIDAFGKQIDTRIIRAAVSGPHYWGRWADGPTERRDETAPVTSRSRVAWRGK